MTFTYPAIFTKEDDGYHAEFPDLLYCRAKGETMDDAIDNAADAAYDWLMVEIEEQTYNFPSVTPLEYIELQENQQARNVMIRIKLLPDSD